MWLFFTLMAGAATAPVHPPLPLACRHAHDMFHKFQAAQSAHCAVDADCEVYYLKGNCEKPVALAKVGYEKMDKAQLARLQAQTRKDCPSPAVACAPRPASAACRKNLCVLR